MRPVRLTYGDVGDIEKLEKDRTLMLCPNHDRPDASGRDWYLTGNDQTLGLLRPVSSSCYVRSIDDR